MSSLHRRRMLVRTSVMKMYRGQLLTSVRSVVHRHCVKEYLRMCFMLINSYMEKTIVLTKHLAMFKKDGFKTESHRTLSHEDYAGLINEER